MAQCHLLPRHLPGSPSLRTRAGGFRFDGDATLISAPCTGVASFAETGPDKESASRLTANATASPGAEECRRRLHSQKGSSRAVQRRRNSPAATGSSAFLRCDSRLSLGKAGEIGCPGKVLELVP